MKKKLTQNNNDKMGAGKKIMIGTGIATLVAATAGAYFLYGTEAGKKKRKQIKSWMFKVKAEVLERIENLKEINEEMYHKIVNEVAEKYKAVKEIDAQELAALSTFLKIQWKNIHDGLKGKPKSKSKK